MQKLLNSDEEDAADEAAATAAPLTTRRSMRSRTTSHKIDPGEFVMEAEADEADEEPDSPAAGALWLTAKLPSSIYENFCQRRVQPVSKARFELPSMR